MSMLYFHIDHFIYCIKCLIVVFMETLKSKTTIEQRFGSAMRFYDEVCKRGFQAEISRATGVDTSNLSSIIRSVDILPSLKEGDSRYRYRELSAS